MNTISSLTKAYALAARWHSGGGRRAEASQPYIAHLVDVAQLVAEATGGHDLNLTIAAILHDAITAAGVTPEAVAAAFGPDVAQIVQEVTEAKFEAGPPATVARRSAWARLILLADKTATLRAVAASTLPTPAGWKQSYLAWALEAAEASRGISASLDAAFAEAATQLASQIRGSRRAG